MSELAKKHPHYHKDVRHLGSIDVYRVLSLFNVTDPCLQHAIKKLLVAGGRGAGKDITQDVKEAIDSCNRLLEMRTEDQWTALSTTVNEPIPGRTFEILQVGEETFELGERVGWQHDPNTSGVLTTVIGNYAIINHMDGNTPSVWRIDHLVKL
jgi:hypothetical protein